MIVKSIRTKKVLPGDNLYSLLDTSLPKLKEKDIIVVTSKIVSICEGNVDPDTSEENKHRLIRKESEHYIEDKRSLRFGFTISIKESILIANAGIDESNGNGNLILWPKDPHKSAKNIWKYLKKKFSLKNLGVILTDSHILPLRWGSRGIGLSWCGFFPLTNYIGTPDIFDRNLRVTKRNTLDGLSAAAVIVMGEGNEQTPLAIIRDVPFVEFIQYPPSKKEIEKLRFSLEEDVYSPLLTSVTWKKGGGKQ
ncbi:coenzyme F420-0:L-glutamate ligase [Candidatus Gottesmanbacteria bacterium]|nr:coenzyme F420-0:L-glutamate ligase [Candidatus Gottesmanbacteria bacterium]